MIPQGYPLKALMTFRGEGDPPQEVYIVGWNPVQDASMTDTPVGSRYAPVVIVPGDPYGAWPVPTDGSVALDIQGLATPEEQQP